MRTVRIVTINEDVAMKAGEYKVKAIPIADALIAASAHLIDALVVTDDEHFEKVNVRVLRFRGQG